MLRLSISSPFSSCHHFCFVRLALLTPSLPRALAPPSSSPQVRRARGDGADDPTVPLMPTVTCLRERVDPAALRSTAGLAQFAMQASRVLFSPRLPSGWHHDLSGPPV